LKTGPRTACAVQIAKLPEISSDVFSGGRESFSSNHWCY